ncbi:hypothetical protein DY000_02028475 [Brassica cretica]|uniref:Rho termination factor N-terminal domain-containing protein n=1 Tax=Brassica cretica TaxID=69181 RepID=A0ABQ7DZL3_BRACR|nr:hypothetical protein DY000_02028475 [Brassica cretica]
MYFLLGGRGSGEGKDNGREQGIAGILGKELRSIAKELKITHCYKFKKEDLLQHCFMPPAKIAAN